MQIPLFWIFIFVLLLIGVNYSTDPLIINFETGIVSIVRILVVLLCVSPWFAFLAYFFYRNRRAFYIMCVVTIVTTTGAATRWGGLLPAREMIDPQMVLAFAEERRIAVLECLDLGKEVLDPNDLSHRGRWSRPDTVCKGSSVHWHYPGSTSLMQEPEGWRYFDTHDIAEFSLLSRNGEIIHCTLNTCVLK